MRSRISSKLIIASCVGYFDRAYYRFYVTSWRMLAVIEGNKILELWNSIVCTNIKNDRWKIRSTPGLDPDILWSFPSPSNVWRHWPHSRSMYHMWAVGHSFNMYMNEPSDIFLTCMGVGEKLFHHQVCDVWRHWLMTFKIPDITWDVGHFLTC